MKKIATTLLLTSTLAFSYSLNDFTKDVSKLDSKTSTKSSSNSNLSDSTVTSGLKEALSVGVDFAVKELSKDGGYLNNPLVKIPLPKSLKQTEKLIRKVGGNKIADDLIVSMNKAAATAAPKTASIFADAIQKMSMKDVQDILAGGDDAATNYFKKNTTGSLQNMIKPIIKDSMAENKVASYYDTFNNFYKENVKGAVNSSEVMGYAKNFGVDSYLPGNSDENIDDYVTKKAIDGLFKMVAQKEGEIRKDPIAQTTSLLKQVFGK